MTAADDSTTTQQPNSGTPRPAPVLVGLRTRLRGGRLLSVALVLRSRRLTIWAASRLRVEASTDGGPWLTHARALVRPADDGTVAVFLTIPTDPA